MALSARIPEIQRKLREHHVEGWLLYDFRHTNEIACDFLEINSQEHLTRRLFYWIPAQGLPIQLMHVIEPHKLDHLPGEKKIYASWRMLEAHLQEILKGVTCIAMEYSPRNALPYVSKVDGGTLDLIRSFGVEVVSSAPFLQPYICVWSEAQLDTHREAARVLEATAAKTWSWIGKKLRTGESFSEYDVQHYILSALKAEGCIMEGAPICAVNENSANPHYTPSKTRSKRIQKGDFILIDLWCKKQEKDAVYADIARVAVADSTATERQQEIFNLVRTAQQVATDFIQSRIEAHLLVKGFEVDEVCRNVITAAGYGSFFTHRTGHNIHTNVHGPGAHLDSLETLDDRPLIPQTCYSIEPGVYLTGEFGVRLEYDIYISSKAKIEVIGGIQDSIVTIL